MASRDEWEQLVKLLDEVNQAIHEAFERGEEPAKDGRIRALLDKANVLRQRLGV